MPLLALSGQDHLYFFDAIAPIVSLESINTKIAFRASRYGHGEQVEGDYINCQCAAMNTMPLSLR